MTTPHIVPNTGLFCDALVPGTRLHSRARTLTETDLVNFVNLSWLNEELFTNVHDRGEMAIAGRVVPAALVYACAEGLMTSSFQGTGLAFLNAEVDVKKPVLVGDTIHVECEVIEQRMTSKPGRGIVRTRNAVVNQNGETVLVYTPLRMMRAAARETEASA